MAPDQKNTVESVETSLDLLSLLAELEEANASEIADALDRPVSTVHNHLSTLEQKGYVIKPGGEYRISFKFLEFGGRIRSNTELFKEGRTEADRLAEETGELVNLLVEENGYGVHIYLAKGEKAVTFDSHAGKRNHLHYNAVGKAILADYSRERVDEIIERRGLPRMTPNTTTSREQLFEALETISDQGYALDDEERLEGLRCVAAPVAREDEVIGSISVSGPASRIKGDYFRDTLPEKVVRTADLIGINITYS